MDEEFHTWIRTILLSLCGDDDLSFAEIILPLPADIVRDAIAERLGEGREARSFCEEFLTRRQFASTVRRKKKGKGGGGGRKGARRVDPSLIIGGSGYTQQALD
jgi:hypothetical protein